MYETRLTPEDVSKLRSESPTRQRLAPLLAAIFSEVADRFLETMNIGSSYVKTTGNSTFTVDEQLSNLPCEIGDEALQARVYILEVAEKKLAYVQCLFAANGQLLAKQRVLSLHVSTLSRRTTPFPPDSLAELQRQQLIDQSISIGDIEEYGRMLT